MKNVSTLRRVFKPAYYHIYACMHSFAYVLSDAIYGSSISTRALITNYTRYNIIHIIHILSRYIIYIVFYK